MEGPISDYATLNNNGYLNIALTGDVDNIKTALKELAENGLNIALHYGYVDDEGLFQVKELPELFKQ